MNPYVTKLIAIYGTVFSSFLAVGLVLPLAPVTLVDRLGEGESMVGYSLFALAVGGLLGRFVGGALVDARGVLVGFHVGIALAVVGASGYLFTVSTWSFVIGRAVLGVGESTVYIAAATALMSLVPEHRRSRFLGLLGSAVWGGISLGPAIGEHLDRVEPAGWITISALMIGLALVHSVFRTVPVTHRKVALRIPRAALLPGTVVGLYNLGYAGITGFVILHLRAEQIRPAWALTTYGLAVLFGRVALGGIPDRLGPRPSLAAGISLMMFALVVIAAAPNRIAVLIALVIFGLGYSMPFPAIASFTVDRTAESERASGLAVLGGMYDVFVGIAGIVFGLLAESRFGISSVYVVSFFASAAGLALALLVVMPTSSSRRGRVETAQSSASSAA
jgi:MFS family permease